MRTSPDDPTPGSPFPPARFTPVLHVCNGVILALFLSFCLLTWDRLPPRIPAHFDAGGAPDAWVPTTWGRWLAPWFVSAGLTAFLYLNALWIPLLRRFPQALNLPARNAFLALPSHHQDPVWNRMRAVFFEAPVYLNLVFFYLQSESFRLAQARTLTLRTWPAWILAALVLVVIVVRFLLLHRLLRRFSREVAEPRTEP